MSSRNSTRNSSCPCLRFFFFFENLKTFTDTLYTYLDTAVTKTGSNQAGIIERMTHKFPPTICRAVANGTFPHSVCLNPTECDSCFLISCLLSMHAPSEISVSFLSPSPPDRWRMHVTLAKEKECGGFNETEHVVYSSSLGVSPTQAEKWKAFQWR